LAATAKTVALLLTKFPLNNNSTPESSLSKPRYLIFDWGIYVYATCAGLAVLIPIPLLDWLFEEFFRRRIPATIAKRRQQNLNPFIVRELNYSEGGCLKSCLWLPFTLLIVLLKKISQKILYFLTIKEAGDKVSHYWHQAFLIDYMLVQGHLADETSARVARLAMEQVLKNITTSPLTQLASQIIQGTRHVGLTLFKFRRGNEDEVMAQTQSNMAASWANYEGYLKTVAALYDQTYQAQLLVQAQAAEAGVKSGTL